MKIKTVVAIATCCIISACVMFPMSTGSGAAAEIGSHPIYTAVGGFYVRSPTDLGLQAAPTLVFDGPRWRPSSSCIPPSLAAYQTAPQTWDPNNSDTFACRHTTLVPLPIGTAIQVDSVTKSWDFENGTQYLVSAHLADPALPQRNFEIGNFILKPVRGSQDEALHLNPSYFTLEPPKAAQP